MYPSGTVMKSSNLIDKQILMAQLEASMVPAYICMYILISTFTATWKNLLVILGQNFQAVYFSSSIT